MSEPRLPTVLKVVLDPIQSFFRLEAASGILLVLAAAAALLWANSPAREAYHAFFSVEVSGVSLHTLINDGLMAIFFLVVGMEIKAELVVGELSRLSQALLPAIAAVGGMIVPAAIYLAFNLGKPSQAGWAVPMATDIAFAIGVLTLLKSRVPHGLIVFLTALAIFDDMGGILVIALFYGSGLSVPWLLGAAGVTGVLLAFNRLSLRSGLVWGVLGAVLWVCLHKGGIHATISGVILGLCIPARIPSAPGMTGTREPPLNRFVRLLHPYVAFGIVPLFALANSGISLGGVKVEDLLAPVPLGVGLGLLLGKPLGIFLSTAIAVRARLASMPGEARLLQLFGTSIVAGIGFTVAIFVGTLAFKSSEAMLLHAKLGILLGSLSSALVGYLVLRLSPLKLPGQLPRATVKAS